MINWKKDLKTFASNLWSFYSKFGFHFRSLNKINKNTWTWLSLILNCISLSNWNCCSIFGVLQKCVWCFFSTNLRPKTIYQLKYPLQNTNSIITFLYPHYSISQFSSTRICKKKRPQLENKHHQRDKKKKSTQQWLATNCHISRGHMYQSLLSHLIQRR